MSGSGFQHDIAGGNGDLIIVQLQSPNFDQATATGWAILKNGAAFFFDVTVSGTIIVGTSPATQIELTDTGGVGQLLFLLNNALFGNALLESAVISGFGQVLLNGPKLLSLPDFVGLEVNSNNGSGSANLQLIYTDANGTGHIIASASDAGWQIPAGIITAVEPGTGTSPTNAAFPETWHAAVLSGSWAGSGGGVNGLWYRMAPFGPTGTVEIIADIQNATATGNSTCFTLPAGYRPATSQNHPAAWNNPQASNSATPPWVFVSSGGAVQITGIEVANKGIFFHIYVPLESL